jgi:hypothetical protein
VLRTLLQSQQRQWPQEPPQAAWPWRTGLASGRCSRAA